MTTTTLRHKGFGYGITIALTHSEKKLIMRRAQGFCAQDDETTGTRKLSLTALQVLRALLYVFHNCKDGRCFPSYERIAEEANCDRSSVGPAIERLEALNILTWHNRLKRVRRWVQSELLGEPVLKVLVVRASNAYRFFKPERKPQAPEAEKKPVTTSQLLNDLPAKHIHSVTLDLMSHLERLKRAFDGRKAKPPD